MNLRTRRESPPLPRVFSLRPEGLAFTKAHLSSPALKPALDKLLQDADKAMRAKPESVMDKTLTPTSGDRHDYISLAPYFWPDPKKADGLPYLRRDGEHNPEVDRDANSDARRFGRVIGAVETLSLAFHLTGKEFYGERAARLLRTWFLDPTTRMNPNLNFGQAIRGVNEGRGTGIIETAKLSGTVDCVGLLADSKDWTARDQAGMRDWMKAYLIWLQTSKNGRDEAKAKNNHGTYYDIQVASLALFTDQADLARRTLHAVREKRIAAQIEPDGKMPLELARTKALSYSAMNLRGLEQLAILGEKVGVNLWDFQTSEGRGIRKAVAFLAPYADPGKPWPYPQITRADRASLIPLLRIAYSHYNDAAWLPLIAQGNRSDPADRSYLTLPETV